MGAPQHLRAASRSSPRTAARSPTARSSTFRPTAAERRPSPVTVNVTLRRRLPLRARLVEARARPGACATPRRIADPSVSVAAERTAASSSGRVPTIVGNSYSICFTARPGIELGPQAASLDATPGGGTTASAHRRHARRRRHARGRTTRRATRARSSSTTRSTSRISRARTTSTTTASRCRPAGTRRDVPPQPPAGRLRPRRLRPAGDAAQAAHRRHDAARRAAGDRRRRRPDARDRHAAVADAGRPATSSRTCRWSASPPAAAPIPRTSSSSRPGGSGFYTVQVTGYNGATSPEPYMLRVATRAAAHRRRTSPARTITGTAGPALPHAADRAQHGLPRQPPAARGHLRLDTARRTS